MENAGAQNGFLLLEKEGTFFVQASSSGNSNTIHVMQDLLILKLRDRTSCCQLCIAYERGVGDR